MSEKWKFTDGMFDVQIGDNRTNSEIANEYLGDWIEDSPVVTRPEASLYWSTLEQSNADYTAHLIMIEPIVKESEERQILRELEARYRPIRVGEFIPNVQDLADRARKLLGSK